MCFISILHGSLGSVFTEDVGDLGVFKFDGYVKRCPSFRLGIYIRTISDQQFNDFLVAAISCRMQRSRSTSQVHIRTSGQVLFNGFNVS